MEIPVLFVVFTDVRIWSSPAHYLANNYFICNIKTTAGLKLVVLRNVYQMHTNIPNVKLEIYTKH